MLTVPGKYEPFVRDEIERLQARIREDVRRSNDDDPRVRQLVTIPDTLVNPDGPDTLTVFVLTVHRQTTINSLGEMLVSVGATQ
jgi:hypothetical protein